MAIIQSDVTAIAPELASKLSIGAWTDILAYVNELDLTQINESAQVARTGQIFLAAHIGTMAWLAGRGNAGPVTSESAGGLRRSYGLLPQWSGHTALSSTRYGQMYLDILGMSLGAGPWVV